MDWTALISAKDEFHKDLDRTEELLRLVKAFREFGTSVPPPEIADGTASWPESIALVGAAPKVRTDLPLLSGSLLLYVCGRFEYFVREVIIAIADEMAASVKNYSELPTKLREELQARTLEVCRTPQKYGYDAAQADTYLVTHATNISGTSSTTISISSRVLAITESNMNQRTLADIFKRINFTEIWTDIGKQASMKTKLGKALDKECTASATARLDEIMRERNSVAHPSGSFSFPDPDQVLDSVDFLRALSVVLVDIAQVPRK